MLNKKKITCWSRTRGTIRVCNAREHLHMTSNAPPQSSSGSERGVSEEDRQYASELLADLTSGDLPRLEIAARWFRKARLEKAITDLAHRESAKQELTDQAQALDMGYGGDRAECQDPWVDPALTKLAEDAAKRIARAERLDNVSAKEIYRVIMGALVESRMPLAMNSQHHSSEPK